MRLIYCLFLWYGFEAIITSNKYWDFPQIIYSLSRIVDELFIILFLANIILNFHTHSKYITKPVRLFSLSFLGILCFSSVINQVSTVVMAEYLLRYGKGLIIFIYCTMFLKIERKYFFYFMKYLRWFFLLQFALNGIWALDIKIIPNNNFNNIDWAIGSLGNPFYVAIFTCIVLTGSIYEFLFRNGISKKRIFDFVYIILCLIQFVWTDTKHLYLIFPLILIFQIFFLYLIKFRNKLIILILLGIISSGLINNTATHYLVENYNRGIRLMNISPKGLAYYHSFFSIPNEVPFSPLGAGPGKGGSFIGKEDNSYFTKKYFARYDIEELRVGSSISTVPYTGITSIQSELGFLGLGIFIFMIILIFKRLWSKNKFCIENNIYNHLTQIDFIALFCLIFWVVENVLADYLQTSFFPGLVWFFISISYLDKKNNFFIRLK